MEVLLNGTPAIVEAMKLNEVRLIILIDGSKHRKSVSYDLISLPDQY